MRTSKKTHGFVPAFQFIKPDVRAGSQSRGFSVTKILTHWAEIVGQDIAEKAVPVSITFGNGQIGATLVILTNGSFALMIEMQKDSIIEKVNACYGYRAINKLRITQTAPGGFHEGKVAFTHAPAKVETIDPHVKKKAEQWSSDVQNDSLKNAIEQLSISFLTKLNSR